jgi:twitching motility protein PilT
MQPLVRGRLAQVLRYVVGQRLLPKKGGGRVAALEVMGTSLRVRELIQNGEDEERTFYQAIADAKANLGWQNFDQHVLELFSAGKIDEEAAQAYASDGAVVRQEIDRLRSSRGEVTSDLGDLEMDRLRSMDDWKSGFQGGA